MKTGMDALSSKTFQPIQPDGYVLSSLGKEAPKIEITETESLCQGPLSPTGCDMPLCEWEDLHHHVDGAVPGDCLADQHDHRRGSLSRRAEGGPGKCPSPSRNSPRRHSPVPYSPKRQNRTRSSASSVASEELPDVSLSPRRHSPVPGSPHVERPSSLSLASGSAEEFICVSYADPFSSPTIAHTSEAILAISINCSGDQDVEMTAPDIRGVEPDHALDGTDILTSASSSDILTSVNSSDILSSVNSSDILTFANSSDILTSANSSDMLTSANSSAAAASLNGSRSPLREESFPQSSQDECENQPDHVNSELDSSAQAGSENCAFMESAKSVEDSYDTIVVSDSRDSEMQEQSGPGVAESGPPSSDRATAEGGRVVECMEGQDGFPVDEVTDSDSSSDDEMIDFVSLPQPFGGRVPVNYSPSGCGMSPFCKGKPVASDTPCSSLTKCSQNQKYECPHSSCDPQSCRYEETDGAVFASPSLDLSASLDTQTSPYGSDRNQGRHSLVDQSAAQYLPNEVSSPPSSGTGKWADRRSSSPDQPPGLCSSPLSSCSSNEASPKRSVSLHASKTPEDFALCCVVGSPPLTFPHCQHAVLVHCSLPSPYDPDLPTPPIVLTPHTSYEDLNFDATIYEGREFHASNFHGRMPGEGGCGETEDLPFQRPNITRSRSFPKLNQNEDHFQEPDQSWPVLGHPQIRPADGGHVAQHKESGRQWECRRNSDSSYIGAEVTDMGDVSDGAISVSLPGSPSNSRAAMIGRLRSVVERRLSGTSESLGAGPGPGGGQ